MNKKIIKGLLSVLMLNIIFGNTINVFAEETYITDEEILELVSEKSSFNIDNASVMVENEDINDELSVEKVIIERDLGLNAQGYQEKSITLYATYRAGGTYDTVDLVYAQVRLEAVVASTTHSGSYWRKITSFNHKITSYDYLFGRPIKLVTECTQHGISIANAGGQDSSEFFSSTLTTNNVQDGVTYTKNTGFNKYTIDSKSMLGNGYLETTLTFEHKDGKTTKHTNELRVW